MQAKWQIVFLYIHQHRTAGLKADGIRLLAGVDHRAGRLLDIVESYRGPRVMHHNIPVSGEINLPGVQGRTLDMTCTLCLLFIRKNQIIFFHIHQHRTASLKADGVRLLAGVDPRAGQGQGA